MIWCIAYSSLSAHRHIVSIIWLILYSKAKNCMYLHPVTRFIPTNPLSRLSIMLWTRTSQPGIISCEMIMFCEFVFMEINWTVFKTPRFIITQLTVPMYKDNDHLKAVIHLWAGFPRKSVHISCRSHEAWKQQNAWLLSREASWKTHTTNWPLLLSCDPCCLHDDRI